MYFFTNWENEPNFAPRVPVCPFLEVDFLIIDYLTHPLLLARDTSIPPRDEVPYSPRLPRPYTSRATVPLSLSPRSLPAYNSLSGVHEA